MQTNHLENYKNYTASEFIKDAYFQQWVQTPGAETIAFWQAYQTQNSDQVEAITEAKNWLTNLKFEIMQAPEGVQDTIWQHITDKIATDNVKPLWLSKYWRNIAASIAGLLLVSFLAYFFNQSPSLITHQGEEKTIQLPDGSVVMLSASAQLSYTKEFGKNATREVWLSGGEAFFKVAKNPEKPFLVYCGEVVTKVLGTSFNIKPATSTKSVEVEVFTGKVSVFNKKLAQKTATTSRNLSDGVILLPNQKVTYFVEDEHFVTGLSEKPSVIKSEEVPAEVINFTFSETPLKTVLATLERAYGIEIMVENEKLNKCPLTADLNDLPLFTQLDLISQSLGATYTVKGTSILVSGKGCN